MVLRVLEVLDASETDAARSAYMRVLSRPTALVVAKNTICLLLWLETTMRFDILQNVATMAPDSLTRVVMEANALCSYILYGYDAMPMPLEGIPAIMALCGGGRLVDYRFFKFHKDIIARGVTMIRNTIAGLVFDDNLHAMLRWYEQDPDSVPAPALVAPFVIHTTTLPQDFRTVFITAPECHPLTSEEIKNYFEGIPGLGLYCIEHVAMERPCAGQSAKHGVVVFRSTELMNEAMCGETAIFMRVDDRDIWVQLYMPPW